VDCDKENDRVAVKVPFIIIVNTIRSNDGDSFNGRMDKMFAKTVHGHEVCLPNLPAIICMQVITEIAIPFIPLR
jgi:hypothetical protein